jgi:hypothetical protein
VGRMNAGRGLFRAWIVVSILWIGVVAGFYAPLFGSNYAPMMRIKGSPSEEATKVIRGPSTPNFYNYVASPAAEKQTVEFVRSRSAEPMTKTNYLKFGFPDGTTLHIPAGYNQWDRDYIAEQFEQQEWSRRMSDIALFGVVPLVVLFALGYVLLWVARFRSTLHRQSSDHSPLYQTYRAPPASPPRPPTSGRPSPPPRSASIFNNDNKWDIQLQQGQIAECELAGLLCQKIELKSESYLWRRTGNICIEFLQNGRPSGIAVTEAKLWVHQLLNDDRTETVAYLMFPIERLKELCRSARVHENGGDGGRFSNYLVKIADIFK